MKRNPRINHRYYSDYVGSSQEESEIALFFFSLLEQEALTLRLEWEAWEFKLVAVYHLFIWSAFLDDLSYPVFPYLFPFAFFPYPYPFISTFPFLCLYPYVIFNDDVFSFYVIQIYGNTYVTCFYSCYASFYVYAYFYVSLLPSIQIALTTIQILN